MLIFLLAEVSYWWQMTAVQRKFTSAFFWAILLCIIIYMMKNTSVRGRKVALETMWYSLSLFDTRNKRQKANLKGKHGLFCNNFLSHLYMCTASSCLLRLQKVSSVHLKPETQGWFLKLQLYILYFWFEKILWSKKIHWY